MKWKLPTDDEFPKSLYVALRGDKDSRTFSIAFTEEEAMKYEEGTVHMALYKLEELWTKMSETKPR